MGTQAGDGVIATPISRLVAVTGGTLLSGDSSLLVTGVARIDSRDVASGDLFVAWRGENLDGHDFVGAATAQGAVAALVERRVDSDVAQILVEDTVVALTALAADHARRLAATCAIVGITGSNGKTTTKDLLAQVLESEAETISPPGSFNNEIGMPLTVLRADASTRYLVLEMGARGKGHIAHLCAVAQPRVGVALNVGSAHVGEFGSPDQIAEAKAEIVESLPDDGFAILNGDDGRTRAMSARTRAHVVLFGEGLPNDVRASDIVVGDDGCADFMLSYQGDAAHVALALPGAHVVSNALAAASVALSLGLALDVVARSLTAARARSRWRMEVSVTPREVKVVNDAYNANPESVAAALSSVADMPRGARLWAVLGEMLELGDRSEAAHRAVGAQVAAAGVDVLVAVGGTAIDPMLDAAQRSGMGPERVLRVPDAVSAARLVNEQTRPGDLVLVKASRSVGLEIVAEALNAPDGQARLA